MSLHEPIPQAPSPAAPSEPLELSPFPWEIVARSLAALAMVGAMAHDQPDRWPGLLRRLREADLAKRRFKKVDGPKGGG